MPRWLALPQLARSGGIAFFVGTLVYNGGNFVFHMAMSRMLGPARYGALGSLLGLVTVAVLPVSALQAAVTQSVAARRAAVGASDPDRAASGGADHTATVSHGALRRPFLWTAVAAAAVMAVTAATAPVVDRFVSLGSPTPLLLVATYVAASVATIVPQGVLIGRLRFRPVAASLVAGSVIRLASGVVLVGAGFGLDAAAAASALAGLASLAVVVWPLRHEVSLAGPVGQPAPADGSVHLEAGPAVLAVVALAGVSAFLGLDSLLARHYLSRVDAGYYVAASTAARVALFLPGAVAMTMFPRLVANRHVHHEARRLLVDALGLTTLLSGGAAAAVALFPHLVIAVLFGPAYQAAAGPLAILSAAAAAMGLASVLVYSYLAQSSPLATGCWAAVCALAGAVALDHRGLDTIAWETLAVTAGATLVMTVLALAQRHPERRTAVRPVGWAPAETVARTAGPLLAPAPMAPAVVGDPTARREDPIAACGDPMATVGHPLAAAASTPTAGDGPRWTEPWGGARWPPLLSIALVHGALAEASHQPPTTNRRSAGPGRCGHLDVSALVVAAIEAGAPIELIAPNDRVSRRDALAHAASLASGVYVATAASTDDVRRLLAVTRHAILDEARPGPLPDIVLGEAGPRRRVPDRLARVAGAAVLPVHRRDLGRPVLLLRRTVLLDVLPRTVGDGPALDLELVAVSRRLGHRRIVRTAGTIERATTVAAWLRHVLAVGYRMRVLHAYDGTPGRPPADDDPVPDRAGPVEEAVL
jgi:O-antigen/teichoic acid export membrane protein